MSSETYFLNFDRHHIESAELPDWSGIYCVYAFRHNAYKTSFYARGLLYIGESKNIRDRVSNHEHRKHWESKLQKNEVLLFRAASISPENRTRAEAAMIYQHKPPCNEEHKHSFPFDETTIKISGNTDHLTTDFTVGANSKPTI